MSRILVMHGPNLNLLGGRETEHYGRDTLAAIDQRLAEQGRKAGVTVESFQSNAEVELVERVHSAKSDETAYIVINPAAFTHTSVALRDAPAPLDRMGTDRSRQRHRRAQDRCARSGVSDLRKRSEAGAVPDLSPADSHSRHDGFTKRITVPESE